MKVTRLFLVAVATVLAVGGFNAYAFHSGGVAECEGCHSMHEASSGPLLIGGDASSTCLNCHQNANDTGPSSYHISTAGVLAGTGGKLPLQMTPGGDFSWTKMNYVGYDQGYEKGHNIVAVDYGYLAQLVDRDEDGTVETTSPGGNFPNSQLSCASCHDPHGKGRIRSDGTFGVDGEPIYSSGSYGAQPSTDFGGLAVGIYRILWAPGSPDAPLAFGAFPVAVVPSSYNRSEAISQTRTAYGGDANNNWGNWCGTCHDEFNVLDGNSTHHPTGGALGSDIAGNYNSYVSSGVMTGSIGTSFLSLVPFAQNTVSIPALAANAANRAQSPGPGNSDTVMCLTCHRAHASGFTYALRWDYGWEFMTYGDQYPGLDNTYDTSTRKPQHSRGRNRADFQRAYYERPEPTGGTGWIGPYNRVLCNKCHAQD